MMRRSARPRITNLRDMFLTTPATTAATIEADNRVDGGRLGAADGMVGGVRGVGAEHRRDTQNVHDHTIARIVNQNLARVSSSLRPGERVDGHESVRQATDFLLTSDTWDGTAKADALDVLDSLNDSPNESAGISQLGALSAVWSAVHRISCPEKRRNVRETLVDQLRSAKENGNVVCSTGRIARIASALDGIDEPEIGATIERARPMWVVRDEIASLASNIRDEFAKVERSGDGGGGDDGIDGIDGDGDADRDTSPAATAFARRARAEYVDKLKFSSAIMDPLIAEFAEHL